MDYKNTPNPLSTGQLVRGLKTINLSITALEEAIQKCPLGQYVTLTALATAILDKAIEELQALREILVKSTFKDTVN